MDSRDLRLLLLVGGALAAPLFTAVLALPDLGSLPHATSVMAVLTFTSALIASVLLYYHWRLVETSVAAWVAVAVVTTAVQDLSLIGHLMVEPERVGSHPAEFLLSQIFLVLVLGAMVVASHRSPVPVNPALLGMTVGVVVSALRYVLLDLTPSLPQTPLVLDLLGLMFVGLMMLSTALTLRLPGWTMRVRLRAAAALTLLVLSRSLVFPFPESELGTSALATQVVSAVLLCFMAFGVLRFAIRHERETMAHLHHRLDQLEAESRIERARMHEVNATVAGIASASRLLRDLPVGEEDRKLLGSMVETEIGRLERLVHGDQETAAGVIELDEVLGHLVVAHRARGLEVTWSPSSHRVTARLDDVAEIVNILLDNAAKHGVDGAVVDVVAGDEMVEITVHDHGPGIAPEVRKTLFEWGTRGPLSHGQGIGLNLACQLAQDQGGYLRLLDTTRGGTTFAIGLPTAREHHDAISEPS